MEGGKVISEAISPQAGILRESDVEEGQNGFCELFKSVVVAIVGDVFVHDFSTPLDSIEVGAIGRQMVQLDA